ncbi:MAG: DUF3302 domain-containing protein [Pseudorhodoplanes sp.]|jgi:hypothetical protein|nr:DUF3302 domain-containing protein [Pseudorhodoplanes sp.]
MTGLDIVAGIVLIVLAASTIFVIVFMAMLPGIIVRRRNHPFAQRVNVAGWVTFFFGFVSIRSEGNFQEVDSNNRGA